MTPLSRDTSASPAQVWDVLCDGWLYGNWVVGTARIRDVAADWPAVGSRLAHSVGAWPFLLDDETVVRDSEPMRHLGLKARGWPFGEARVDITLTARPGGCTITIAEDASGGPGRLVPEQVRQAVIRTRNRETLRRLAYIAEGRSR